MQRDHTRKKYVHINACIFASTWIKKDPVSPSNLTENFQPKTFHRLMSEESNEQLGKSVNLLQLVREAFKFIFVLARKSQSRKLSMVRHCY